MSWGKRVVLGMTTITTVGMYIYVYMQENWRYVHRTAMDKYVWIPLQFTFGCVWVATATALCTAYLFNLSPFAPIVFVFPVGNICAQWYVEYKHNHE